MDAAFSRFERLAPIEAATLCEMALPIAQAELWKRVTEWQLRPLRSLTGYLFERV